MHRIRIKPNERKGAVRVEATLHNTSHGEVQRFKYFPSSDKSCSLESTAKDIRMKSPLPYINGQQERLAGYVFMLLLPQ